MAFTITVFNHGKSPWWRKVTDAVLAALPGTDILVFRGIDEWLGAARGISGEQILLMGPSSSAEVDAMLAVGELVRDKDVLVVLPRDMEGFEGKIQELRPRLVLTDSVSPDEVAEAVKKMHDRSRRRSGHGEWRDIKAVK